MNKAALEKFAPWARKKLIEDTKFRAELYGITSNGVQTPDTSVPGVQKFEYAPGMFTTISGRDIARRERLVARMQEVGYEQLIEENAYAWFNRLIAIRFMEVHGYLDARVLSSETVGKAEPDIIEQALDLDLGLSDEEKQLVLTYKQENKIDDLFKLLFIKQCNALSVCLPGMFQNTEDYSELLFPLSYTNPDGVVKKLISDIAEEDFSSVEIIGWLYQYYNSDLNALVYDGKMRREHIPKELLPAATTMYTPEWAIQYMVENSLGKLWLEGNPSKSIKDKLKYYLENAGINVYNNLQYNNIIKEHSKLSPEDIKFFDPCMGSGHILVYAFDIFILIYESLGYQKRDAAKLILENNLYGLDIDDRAGQLAYFSIMMKAREYNRKILEERVNTNLCSIHESNLVSEDFLKEVSGNDITLLNNLFLLKEAFNDAKEYGSILNIKKEINFKIINDKILDLQKSPIYKFNYEYKRLCILLKQSLILFSKYDVVVTNPPYFSNSRFNNRLGKYVNENYPLSKYDLSTVMFSHALDTLVKKDGFVAFITTNSWFFLSSYEKFRKKIQLTSTFDSIVDFGTELFDGKIGHNPIVSWVSRNSVINKKITAIRLVDFCYSRRNEKKSEYHNIKNRYYPNMDTFSKIPGSPIAYWVSEKTLSIFKNKAIGNFCDMKQGLATTDNNRFLRMWYEIMFHRIGFDIPSTIDAKNSMYRWFPYNKGGKYRKWYGNNEYVVNYENDGYEIKKSVINKYKYLKNPNFVVKNTEFYFKEGFTWSTLTAGKFSCRYSQRGFIFDAKGSSGYSKDNSKLLYLMALLNSVISDEIFKILAPTLDYNCGPVSKFPVIFDDRYIYKTNNIVKITISISKDNWDSFETSWDFQKHPFLAYKGKSVKESFKYWSAFAEEQFQKLKDNEEELNRIFIEIYGLQDELSPEEEDKDVTISRADLTRDVKSFISYAVGCMFGRYSLDTPGLAYAGGEWDASKYKKFTPDEDGIIPITDRDYFPDDIVGRFIEFLKVTYGEDTLEENLDFIADALGTKGKTSREIIRNYFLKGFYDDHLKIYQKRPIYWLFDSGKENGFKALIYLHRYNRDTVGRIRTDYLHETQKKIEGAIHQAEFFKNQGTPAQQKKANDELSTLHKQLEETQKYDAAIANIALQRIDLDLDDGVKVNYEKFQNIDMGGEGKMKKTMNLLAVIK